MEFAKLVLLCLASLCGYGAVLGGVSAALCPEAFTLGRPPFFEHWPALAIGATWGALDLLMPATFAGLALGIAANFGPQPALKAAFFRHIIPGLLGLMTFVAVVSGGIAYAVAYFATRPGMHAILGPLNAMLDEKDHPMLAAVWWASLTGLFALIASNFGQQPAMKGSFFRHVILGLLALMTLVLDENDHPVLAAVWWVLLAGLLALVAANFGQQPAMKGSFFRRVILGLLALMTLVSVVGGVVVHYATRPAIYALTIRLNATLPFEKQPMLAAVWWASLGALLALFASAIILAAWTWRKRAHYAELLRRR